MRNFLAVVLMLGGLLPAALAAPVCTGQRVGQPGAPVVGASDSFVKNTFIPLCSANVFLDVNQSATNIGVGAASSKGKSVFASSTGTVGVVATGTQCPANGCSQAESAAAAAAALAAANSS